MDFDIINYIFETDLGFGINEDELVKSIVSLARAYGLKFSNPIRIKYDGVN